MIYRIIPVILLLISPTYVYSTDRLHPSDLSYQGAFRLPTGVRNGSDWYDNVHQSSGMGWDSANNCILMQHLTDAGGSVTECIVPATPTISATKDVTELTASTVATNKSFTAITLPEYSNYKHSDTEYFPQQSGQSSAKYYWIFYDYYETSDSYNTVLGWSDLDFSTPNAQGLWNLGSVYTRRYDKYMLKIDDTWAQSVLGFSALGVGRNRTNASNGPSLYAIRPWVDGSPPADGADLTNQVLIRYDDAHPMESFNTQTRGKDAVWLKYGTKQALVVYQDAGIKVEGTLTKWWNSAGGRSVAYKNCEEVTSTLSEAITIDQATVPLSNVTYLSPSGRVRLLSTGEHVSYTGISGNTLTGVTRGVDGTTAKIAPINCEVAQIQPDTMDYGSNIDGYDTIFTIPMLLFYDVDQIAEVARGTRQSYAIQPYAYMPLDKQFYRSAANTETANYPQYQGGITFDGSTSVYIGEAGGEPTSVTLLHKFSIAGGGADDVTSPASPSYVSVNSSGLVTWGASDEDVTYVIYKWFPNAYMQVSEYRPIRTNIDRSWEDPHYVEGDKYQIIAFDTSMNMSAPITTDGYTRQISLGGTGQIPLSGSGTMTLQ